MAIWRGGGGRGCWLSSGYLEGVLVKLGGGGGHLGVCVCAG